MRSMLFLVLPWAAIGIAVAIVAVAARYGKNVFKTQGVAWLMTLVMVVVSIGIGYAKSPTNNPKPETPRPSASNSYVWDNAKVLSGKTKDTLNARNDRLWERYRASIGVVTCDDVDDLGEYAMQCAGDMGLGGYDFVVALDIEGENYWLVQGDDIRRKFTDQMCSDYAYDYMEDYFARGMYDDALLDLTEALENWYEGYYG